MTGQRLSRALEAGLAWPEAGRIAVFAARAGAELHDVPHDRMQVITGFRPDFEAFERQGVSVAVAPEGAYGAALICVPRSKIQAQALIAQAVAVTDGPVIVDGAKTDGIESLLKACRKRVAVSAPVSKAHGKLFWFEASPAFNDWTASGNTIEEGFVTAPGVFSADGIDPASRMLGDHLPAKLGAHVADLGGGWGYLSARALERDTIQSLHLVEAEHAATLCATTNITDPRAQIHWADATTWTAPGRLDAVISNPPFHTDRAADPALGRAFIASAARLLAPSGQFWMVANRHLPYEDSLRHHFAHVDEVAGDTKFKILHGSRPSRQRR
ncbi:MAG: class I SAM-dependent methyltransferase [Roseovarius sp.]